MKRLFIHQSHLFKGSLFFLLTLSFLLFNPACRSTTQTVETVTKIVEVTATPQPTTEPTATAVPDHIAVTFEGDLENFHPGDPLILHFNQPMKPRSRPLLFSPTINGEFVWSDDNSTLTFTPDSGFGPRNYTVTLPQNTTSAAGQTLAQLQRWTLDPVTAPTLLRRTPNGSKVMEQTPTITLRFSEAMDEKSVIAALSVEPNISFVIETSAREAIITIDEPLAFGTKYTFTLSKTAVSAHNVSFKTPYTWSIEMADPIARFSYPSNDNHLAPIQLTFNYPIDERSFSQAFNIKPTVQGKISWNARHTEVTFTPNEQLPAQTNYAISFEQPLLGLDGAVIPIPYKETFSSPPPILSHKPEGTRVSPDHPITIRFDRLMDQTTTEAAFTIEPAVNGRFQWQETTLSFIPDRDEIQENSAYTVTLAASATGQDGEPISDQATSWQFTTSHYQNVANFGYGPNAQVLDVNGRRAIQYQMSSHSRNQVTFELYSLSLEQFLDRYASGFRGWAGWGNEEKPNISLDDTILQKSWDVETTTPTTEYNNVQEVIIPEDVPPGLYILNLVKGNLNDQLILVLTENTVVVKEAEGDLLAWVTDINGEPVSNSNVAVYARNGDLITEGTADEAGIFHTTIPSFAEGGPASIDPLIIVAQNGEDLTVSGLTSEWQSRYGYFSGSWWQRPSTQHSAAYIYTDRPIYKPGHTVQFKAIVRDDDDALLTVLPEGTLVTVRIRDAKDNVVQTLELPTNNFGSIHGEFNIAEGAMLGDYHVELVLNGDSHRQKFKVEDYRKPDYEVVVTTDAQNYLEGETVAVTIDTTYFFGEPVANADVTLRRYIEQYGWYYNAEHSWIEDYLSDGEIKGRTDENGRFTTSIKIPTDINESYYDWGSNVTHTRFGIEATVDDGSHQTVSGFGTVTAYNLDRYLELDSNGYVHKPGEPFSIRATMRTIDDQPVANQQLSIKLNRWSHDSWGYDNTIQSATMTTDENGRASTPFTVEEAGYYQLRVTGQASNGREVIYTTYIYAFSDIYSNWYGRNDGGIRIDPDAQSYAPGDTAQLLVETAVTGPALLVVERGKSRDEQLVWLEAPFTTLELPIKEGYTPNVAVSINIWQEKETTIDEHTSESLPDSGLYTAYTNLSVPATTKNLNVTITPNKDIYAPGEEATFTIRVTNYKGDPVSAELSFALVDEAIFALSEELSGPMYDAFYYERDSIVQTYHSMHPTRSLWEGGMGGGGGDGFGEANPRQNFQDTAVWRPNLQTDFNGEATITVTLPDNLTSWRATSKATTADTQVGSTYMNITTHKEIIVRPILPRVLTAGDNIQLSALVHNYSEQAETLVITLDEILDDEAEAQLELQSPSSQTIELPANSVQIVGWTFNAIEAGEVSLLVEAAYGEDSSNEGLADAVILPLTIQPLAIPDVTTEVGQFNTQLNSTVTIPADSLPMSSVEIQLSRSIAGTLLEGLEYLTGYPYGCVEQTMSKALPNAVVGRALNQLGVTNPTLQAELPAYINASVQRLYGYQHNDGGWGWWYDDPTHDYQTAWVIFGLAQVADAGYEVDPEVISRGVEWINNNLNQMDPRTKAFALYAIALAGEPNAEATLALADDLASLEDDTFSLAGLALALHIIDEDAVAQAIVDDLADTAVSQNSQTHWAGADHDGYYYQKTMSSDIRSTALALSAFTQISPNHPLEANIVRWLMSQRRTQGWGTTNETSFAILGLTDHLLSAAFNEAAAATNYTVLLNGEVITTGQLGKGAPAVTLTVSREQLRDGENDIQITQDGKRPLFYTINSRIYVAQSDIDSAGVIDITRTYLDPDTNKPLTEISAGQLVKVRLEVTMPQDGTYMIVEDKLPGGLEALNEGLNTTSRVASNNWNYEGDDRFSWRERGYNYKEIFGDRVSFFITDMSKGKRTLTYFARATHSGTFTAMPVEAYGMYTLELWGRSASDQVQIVSE